MDFKSTYEGSVKTAKHPVSIVSLVLTIMAGGGGLYSWPHIKEKLIEPLKEAVHGIEVRQDVRIYQACNENWPCVEKLWEDVIRHRTERDLKKRIAEEMDR